jgi:DNA-binding CsgD family transcriptional regulator
MTSKDTITLYRQARTQPPHQFTRYAFDYLRRDLQFDLGALITSSASDPSYMDAHFDPHPSRELMESWGRVAHLNLMGRDMLGTPGKAFAQPWTDPRIDGPEYAPLKAHLRNFRIFHALGIAVPVSASIMSAVILVRHAPDDAYTATECEALEDLVGHLVEALAINRFYFIHSLGGNVMALIAKDGHISYAHPQFNPLIKGSNEAAAIPYLPQEYLKLAEQGRTVRLGDRRYHMRFTALPDGYSAHVDELGLLASLTDRELEIAFAYARGETYRQIASALSLSPATVRNHIANILRKTSLNGRGPLSQIVLSLPSHTRL